jgi:general secretion pathway protein K
MTAHRQRGVALLIVIALSVAVAMLVAALQFQGSLQARRTMNLVRGDQARAYHLGAEDWAGALLQREGRDDARDDFTEPWNQKGLVIVIEGGQLVGTLRDLQGRFNVNELLGSDGSVDEAAVARFRRLLAALGIEESERIAGALVDWLDADQDPRFPFGAEDQTYLRLVPAYRSADRPMLWVGELRAVDGVSAEVYAKLAPNLAALPTRGALNVNTAPLAVLQSLADSAIGDALTPILARQTTDPFNDAADFARAFGHTIPDGTALGVRSQYFALETAVEFDGLTTTMYSLLARTPGGAVRTLRRSADPEP